MDNNQNFGQQPPQPNNNPFGGQPVNNMNNQQVNGGFGQPQMNNGFGQQPVNNPLETSSRLSRLYLMYWSL